MKLLVTIAAIACAGVNSAVAAEGLEKWDPRMAASTAVVDTNGVKWIDGKYLPIEGRWTLGNMKNYYCRLPDTLTTNVNSGVRWQRFDTAGMQFRFKTDSDFIVIKYVSRSHKYDGSRNQAGVNVHGWDLYRRNAASGNKWCFGATSHCSSDVPGEKFARVQRLWNRKGDELLINLPHYDGIESFALGIAPKAKIEALGPRSSGIEKPVVFYGTSITHGASASRPGLSFVNLVGRNLDVPVVNLGFSGCGIMEYELADVIAKIDASCYVLDCIWNMSDDPKAMKNCDPHIPCSVQHNYEPFIRRLRELRPDVPIVMAGQCDVFMNGPNKKEQLMKQIFDTLILEGWQNLYYLPNSKMYPGDLEGTIDTCHPNDLGMASMAKAYGDAVAEALKFPPQNEIAKVGVGASLNLTKSGLSFRPNYFEHNWSHGGTTEHAMPTEKNGAYDFSFKFQDGQVATGRAVFANTPDGKVSARWTFTVDKPTPVDVLFVGTQIPTAMENGYYVVNGKTEKFPRLGQKFNLGACGAAKDYEFLDVNGRRVVRLEFSRPTSVVIQDSSKWNCGFGLRIMFAGRKLEPGKIYEFEMKVSGREGAKLDGVKDPYFVKAGSEWCPFKVKTGVKEGSAIDFTKVCGIDAPAGKYGRVVVRNGHFEFENKPGVIQRFYGVNVCGDANYPRTPEIADKFAAMLARRGYNAIRFHHHDGGLVKGSKDGTTINPEMLRRLDSLADACYRHGIYVTTDLYVSRQVPGDVIGRPQIKRGYPMKMEVKTNELAFANLCTFSKSWLTHVNEFTGKRWADEPGFAFISFVNEGGADNNVNRGRIKDEDRPRYAAEQERFIERMTKFLREEVGSKQLFTDLNNNGHKMWHKSRGMLDYVDAHFYVDHPHFLEKPWRLPSQCPNRIPFNDNGSPQGVSACARYFHEGKPLCITEWNFSGPGNYRGIGGIATGAWSALNNWDGLWRFAWCHGAQGIEEPWKKLVGYFDMSGDPLAIASDRATLCLFLRGDMKPGVNEQFYASKKEGKMLLKTERTCGGFIENGWFDAGVVRANVGSTRATIWASAIDDQPLKSSKRILITHLTDVQNSNCKYLDDSMKVLLDWGKLPHLMRRGRATIELALDPGEFKLYVLDDDGARRCEMPFEMKDGKLVFIADTARTAGEASYLYELVRK